MRRALRVTFCVCLVICAGCGKTKSTAELLRDLKSTDEGKRHSAVRLLPQRKGDAAQIIPALIEALKDKEGEVRRSAALGLGSFGDKAKSAIPDLQKGTEDPDARVREAARTALAKIEPH